MSAPRRLAIATQTGVTRWLSHVGIELINHHKDPDDEEEDGQTRHPGNESTRASHRSRSRPGRPPSARLCRRLVQTRSATDVRVARLLGHNVPVDISDLAGCFVVEIGILMMPKTMNDGFSPLPVSTAPA